MAITGIPLVLENILSAVLKSHDLSTWSLFNEKSGDISIRIKFSSKGQGQTSTEDIYYRRKSQKQVERDRVRLVNRRRSHNFTDQDISRSTPEVENNRNFSESIHEREHYEQSIVVHEEYSDSSSETSQRHSLNMGAINGLDNIDNVSDTLTCDQSTQTLTTDAGINTEKRQQCDDCARARPSPISPVVDREETDLIRDTNAFDTIFAGYISPSMVKTLAFGTAPCVPPLEFPIRKPAGFYSPPQPT